MDLNLTSAMLQKVKTRQGIPADNTESDTVITLMLEDAMQAIRLYCHRTVFPAALEYVARDIVNTAIAGDSLENVASIKRGDTQITYSTAITEDSFTPRQKHAMNSYRRLRIG